MNKELVFTSLKRMCALQTGKLSYSCCVDSEGNNHILFGRYNVADSRIELCYVDPDGNLKIINDQIDGMTGSGNITFSNNKLIVVMRNAHVKSGVVLKLPPRSYREFMDSLDREFVIIQISSDHNSVVSTIPKVDDITILNIFTDQELNINLLAIVNTNILNHYIVKGNSLVQNRIHDGEILCSINPLAIDSMFCIHYVYIAQADSCFYHAKYSDNRWYVNKIDLSGSEITGSYGICATEDNKIYMLYKSPGNDMYSLVLLLDNKVEFINRFPLKDDYSVSMTYIDNDSLLISHGDKSENRICLSLISPLQTIPRLYCQNLDPVLEKHNVPERSLVTPHAYCETHISVRKGDSISGSVVFDTFDEAMDCPCVYESRFIVE